MARPTKWTKIDPKQVQTLASHGVRIKAIADTFGVSDETIRRRFGAELNKGDANLKTKLHKRLVQEALRGNITALIFLSKNYLGMSDNLTINETNDTKPPAMIGFDLSVRLPAATTTPPPPLALAPEADHA